MLMDFVPKELHEQFKSFRKDLAKLSVKKVTSCPYCHSSSLYFSGSQKQVYHCKTCGKYCNPRTDTIYNNLIPIDWFDKILVMRVCKKSYSKIAEQLNTTYEKIKRRNNIMIKDMQQRYPELAEWYKNHQLLKSEKTLTPAIIEQHQALKSKVTELLTKTQANCSYCHSDNTVRIGKRTGFRCRKCYKTFNIVAGTPLHVLPHPELWLTFIDLLVEGKNNKQLSETLNFSHNTVENWRSRWCAMMKEFGFDALSVWCDRRK